MAQFRDSPTNQGRSDISNRERSNTQRRRSDSNDRRRAAAVKKAKAGATAAGSFLGPVVGWGAGKIAEYAAGKYADSTAEQVNDAVPNPARLSLTSRSGLDGGSADRKAYNDKKTAQATSRVGTAANGSSDGTADGEPDYANMSTEDRLAHQYARQQELYEKNYMPLIEELEGEQTSRDFVDDATKTAKGLKGNALARVDRGQNRTVGGLTAAQKSESTRGVTTMAAKSGTSMINMAKKAQRSRNEAITGDMMNVSAAMTTGATTDLSVIAGHEAERKAQYERQKAESGSSLWGTVGSVVGAVAGAYVGQPAVGASVGAGIGSGIGGR